MSADPQTSIFDEFPIGTRITAEYPRGTVRVGTVSKHDTDRGFGLDEHCSLELLEDEDSPGFSDGLTLALRDMEGADGDEGIWVHDDTVKHLEAR